jgi:hypothetical protein
MKNLGRVLLFLLLSYQILFAVTAKISPSVVYEGDRISLILTANGSDVEFPDLKEIAGYKVLSKSSSSNITNINGNISRSISKEYTFVADGNFTVDTLKVTVDGKIEKTAPLNIKVRKQTVGKQEAFSFELVSDKTEAYVGENITVEFIFKQHIDIDLAEANFNSPSFSNFWAKPTGKVPPTIEGDYKVHKIRYILFPQKSGDIEIEAGRIDAGIMQTQKRGFFQARNVKWKSLYTKGLTIKVKPLPTGVDIYGNFKFDVSVDKTNTKANEPINLTIVIKGIGNIDDIDDFKLDIKDAIVYADKPEKKIYTNNKEELGEFVQKFAIVSDRNFTIEPLEFKFFNSVDKKVKILKGKKFDIDVKGTLIKTQTAQLQKKESQTTTETKIERVYDKASKTTIILSVIGGFLAGFITAFLLGFSFKRKKVAKSDLPLSQKIKKTKSDKELLSLLLPSSDKSDKMRGLITKLEENLYENKNHKIDKKELIKNLQTYLKETKIVNEILN